MSRRKRYCISRNYHNPFHIENHTCSLCCLFCGKYPEERIGKLCTLDSCKLSPYGEDVTKKERRECKFRGTDTQLAWRKMLE